jgi:hypothetical protein
MPSRGSQYPLGIDFASWIENSIEISIFPHNLESLHKRLNGFTDKGGKTLDVEAAIAG